MIQEKGFDLTYLLKFRSLKRFINKNKLYKIYMEILYSLDNINSEILVNYIKWKSLVVAHQAELERNKEFNIKDLERTFRDYLESLIKYNKDFEITEHYINPSFLKMFNDLFKDKLDEKTYNLTLIELKKFKDIKFYTWDEYQYFLKDFELMQILGNTEQFKELFILKRTIKLQNIIQLDTHLYDIYSKQKMYDLYQFIRWDIFNIDNIQCERKYDKSAFYELEKLSQIRGIEIDPKNTTLKQYEEIQEAAREKIEQLKNKPKAAGQHGRI